MDLLGRAEDRQAAIQSFEQALDQPVLAISAVAHQGLEALLEKNISTFDPEQYKAEVSQMVTWAFDDLPIMMLRNRTQNWAVAKDIEGILTSFHQRWDFRRFKRAK